jgi:hypothetical protein
MARNCELIARYVDATPQLATEVDRSGGMRDMYGIRDKANQILDEAGYKRGGDGIRVTPDGTRMKVLYSTSINTASEGAGAGQGRLAEDRHRHGIEVHRRGCVLLE